MTTRSLRAHCPCSATALLDRVAGFEQATEALSVTAVDGLTRWRLPFRGASVRWTQRTWWLADRTGLGFDQVEGDLIGLAGEWVATPAAPGCAVTYTVDYRTSVAHLAGAIDPVLGRVLLRAALAVLTAVAPPVRVLDGEQWLADLPPRARRLLPSPT